MFVGLIYSNCCFLRSWVTDQLLDTDGKIKPVVSNLTMLIKQFEEKQIQEGSEKGKIPLTIYLPDCNPLKISAKDTSDFREVINIVLATHKERGVKPPLDYNNPKLYELRIHEG